MRSLHASLKQQRMCWAVLLMSTGQSLRHLLTTWYTGPSRLNASIIQALCCTPVIRFQCACVTLTFVLSARKQDINYKRDRWFYLQSSVLDCWLERDKWDGQRIAQYCPALSSLQASPSGLTFILQLSVISWNNCMPNQSVSTICSFIFVLAPNAAFWAGFFERLEFIGNKHANRQRYLFSVTNSASCLLLYRGWSDFRL